MTSRGKDDAMNGILRQSLAHVAHPREDACPDAEILAAYFDRSLSRDEITACEAHFAACAHCRQQLAAMVRTGEPPEAGRESRWVWDRRWWSTWNWAIAAVLLAVASVSIWRSLRVGDGDGRAPLVAMSQPAQPPEQQPPLPLPEHLGNVVRIAPGTVAPENSKEEGKAQNARELDAQDLKAAPGLGKQQVQSPQVQSQASGSLPGAEIREAPASNPSLSAERNEVQSAAPSAAQAQPNSASNLPANGPPLSGRDNRDLVPSAKKSEPASPTPRAIPADQISRVQTQSAAAAGSASGATAGGLATGAAPAARAAPAPFAALSSAAKLQATEQRSEAVLIRTPNPKILWRIASAGFVERTTDGGATWNGQLPDANAQLVAGAAPDAKTCWLVGNSGVILLTRDAVAWKKIPPPIPADFTAVTAKDTSSATITAVSGQKFSTSDSGKKWQPVP